LVAIVLFSLSDLLHLFCNVHIAFEYLNSVKGKRSKSEELITTLPLRRSAPISAFRVFLGRPNQLVIRQQRNGGR